MFKILEGVGGGKPVGQLILGGNRLHINFKRIFFIIHYLLLKKAEFLFDRVWNTFQQDPFSCAVFLENLEPYILSDQLDVIPTSILQR